MARWTEDLTLDFEPGEMLCFISKGFRSVRIRAYSFLNILAVG
jgi:hypothetical protein